MEKWDKSLVKGKLKEIVEKKTADNVSAIESQVLVESKKKDRYDIVEALVVILGLFINFQVFVDCTVNNFLQSLLLLISNIQR